MPEAKSKAETSEILAGSGIWLFIKGVVFLTRRQFDSRGVGLCIIYCSLWLSRAIGLSKTDIFLMVFTR